MSLDEELTAAFVDGYHVAGKEVGYWGRRFLQAVKRNGGLATAKRMLQPRNEGQRKGLDALLEANRPELTVEAIVLQPKFRSLYLPQPKNVLASMARQLPLISLFGKGCSPMNLNLARSTLKGPRNRYA